MSGKYPWSIGYALLFLAIQSIAFGLGLVGIPLLALLAFFKLWRIGAIHPMSDAWRGGWLTWLFNNNEDGIFGPKGPYTRWQAFKWSALRNPVNNLRYVPGISGINRPLYQKFYGAYYCQAGWNDRGHPVLSVGTKA